MGGNRKKRKPPGISIHKNMWPGGGRIPIRVSIRYQNPPATNSRGIKQMIINYSYNGTYSEDGNGGYIWRRNT